MKKRRHLPLYGVGPFYCASIAALTALGILLARTGAAPAASAGALYPLLAAGGLALLAAGIWLYCGAIFRARVHEHIRQNTLVTDGIYGWVRNPIYSAFLSVCTGALLLADNLWLLALPPVYWLFLTVLMKCTEEKWLAALYGDAYKAYCRRVNRCVPRPPRRRPKE